MSFWRCHYHLIWTTRQRMPVIGDEVEAVIARCISSQADAMQFEIHAIGMVEDHIHVALSIPPRLAVATVVQQFKGSSSNQLGKLRTSEFDKWPGWQPEYGVLTFGDGSFERIVSYVSRQKEHHRSATLWAALEQIRADAPFVTNVSP
jgi:putative transposase